jgi:hypothetical protein
MATFLYRCPADGTLEMHWPVGTAPRQVPCPACGGGASRVYTAPLVSRGSRSAVALIDRTERTRYEPEVVTGPPPAGRSSRRGKHSPRSRWVTGAHYGQAGAGTGGLHGAPLMTVRRMSMTLQPCLRAVSM